MKFINVKQRRCLIFVFSLFALSIVGALNHQPAIAAPKQQEGNPNLTATAIRLTVQAVLTPSPTSDTAATAAYQATLDAAIDATLMARAPTSTVTEAATQTPTSVPPAQLTAIYMATFEAAIEATLTARAPTVTNTTTAISTRTPIPAAARTAAYEATLETAINDRLTALAPTATKTPTRTPTPTVRRTAISPPTRSPIPTSTATQADQQSASTGGTMIWAGHQAVDGLGPDDDGPTVQWALISNLHNALLQFDENYQSQPMLAEAYEVSEDGLSYTFHLRDDVIFHNGLPLTAEDIKYTYEYYGDPVNNASIAGKFEGVNVEIIDDLTVLIQLSRPNSKFLTDVATTWIVSSSYHKEVGEAQYRYAPIGTGAFILKELVPSEYVLLEAFEDHFRGRPKVDYLRYEVVPEPSVRAIALETGDVDSSVWPLFVEDSLRLQGLNYTVYRTLSSGVKHLPLNNSLPQLSDKRVRRAMLLAIDRQRIIDDLWQSAAEIAHSNLAPNSPYYSNNVTHYPYDPEEAQALLDEAGWVDTNGDGWRDDGESTKLTFTCTTITGDQARRPIAEKVRAYLEEIGIEMKLAEAPISTILEGLRNGSIDCSLFNWTYGTLTHPDAFSTLHSDGENNLSHFHNDRVDELLELGLHETDPEKMLAIYQEIQAIVTDEVPFLYLQFDHWYNVFGPRVTGLPDPATITAGNLLYSQAHIMGIQQSD